MTTLRILGRRDVEMPESVRERVRACTGPDQLELRAGRAVHATPAEDLFTAG